MLYYCCHASTVRSPSDVDSQEWTHFESQSDLGDLFKLYLKEGRPVELVVKFVGRTLSVRSFLIETN
jgi:hypothetical protein